MISDNDLKWQTRDDMPTPTNALQRLLETMTFSSRDMSVDKMTAFMYGIIAGWDDESYKELSEKHNWTNEDVDNMKMWHENYKIAWNLFIENLEK